MKASRRAFATRATRTVGAALLPLAASAALSTAAHAQAGAMKVTLAGGSVGGAWSAIGNAIGETLRKEYPGTSFTYEPATSHPGSPANRIARPVSVASSPREPAQWRAGSRVPLMSQQLPARAGRPVQRFSPGRQSRIVTPPGESSSTSRITRCRTISLIAALRFSNATRTP